MATGDRLGGSVSDGEIADRVVIEFDECRSPLQIPEPSGHDRGHVGGAGIDMPPVFRRDGGRGERANGNFSGGHQQIFDVRNGEDLLGLGIVGHAQVMNQDDA